MELREPDANDGFTELDEDGKRNETTSKVSCDQLDLLAINRWEDDGGAVPRDD